MHSRRDFIRWAALTAGAASSAHALPAAVRRALAVAPHARTGTIQDVEHVVILMQENRSFDHYFGTMRGVRGFNDPRPAHMPNGQSVWHQPSAGTRGKHYKNRGLADDAAYVLPWYINPQATTEFQAGTDHGWASGHGAWNHGHWNAWVTQKQDVLTMGHLKREDVSFHFALAEAFTICDAYHCSVHADTCPNRIYHWSGTSDPRNVMGHKPNGPGLWERADKNGYTWTTYPERLEAAGVSWKLYQGGTGEPGSPTDNYTDNSLEFFAAYQVKEGADPQGPLVQKGVTNHTLTELRDDVIAGRFAQVTWIVAPYKYCEHPEASPTDGAYFIAKVLDALTANSEVWSKTALFINYDENDGLFDHVVPPMPPLTSATGMHGIVSSSLEASLQDELLDLDKLPREEHPLIPGEHIGGMQPIGLGPRVPMIIVSPWTRGGYVCSQTFDHTSVLQFLEARFGVHEPNISAWRRAVCGDLTSAFDFSQQSTPVALQAMVPQPLRSLNQPYAIPSSQTMPRQETGTRPARALPYILMVDGHENEDGFHIDFVNEGTAGAAFAAHDHTQAEAPPRRYAVSASDRITDTWTGSRYDLSVYGPNGFLRQFRGSRSAAQIPEAALQYIAGSGDAELLLQNSSGEELAVVITNQYSRQQTSYTLAPGSTRKVPCLLKASSGWYDLRITLSTSGEYLRRFAGHVENGQPCTSDPAVYEQA